MNDFDLSLADFYGGHVEDPLRAPPDFTLWKADTAVHQAMFERVMTRACGAHTELEGRPVVNMASLDYLGITRHPQVLAAATAALQRWGTGAGGVPLLSGTTEVHRQLVQRVSRFVGTSEALLFTSGFGGALGVAGGLLRRGDVAICDERAHISWMDGARMAGARVELYAHEDPAALDAALERSRGRRRAVFVDALYSMDGDTADLPALLDVCETHGVGLVVDEAHSMFAVGQRGAGVIEAAGVRDRVALSLGTFSKALGHVGGFAAASQELIDYVRVYGHSYVFSSAMPPAVAAGILAAIDVAEAATDARQRLAANARYFRAGVHAMGLSTGLSDSHVVPVIMGGDRERLYTSCRWLWEHGLYVAPVDYPAVSMDALRLRCAVSAAHTREDLDQALDLLESCCARPA